MNAFSSAIQNVKQILTGTKKPLAHSPRNFALTDWKDALMAAKDSIASRQIGLLSAGIAFFATFAFFPLMAAGVAIATFFISEANLNVVISSLESYLPADVASLLTTQLEHALNSKSETAIVAIVGILIALFSVSGAVQNLIAATNFVYEREETRGLVGLRATSLMVLLGGLAAGAIIISLLVIDDSVLISLGIPAALAWVLSMLRWFVIALVIGVVLAYFYRYGPDRANPKWQWVTWGSLIASVIWMIGTVLFFIYTRYFGNFSHSYSLFAGIIVLMTWFQLTAFIILFGAAINHRLEQQTVRKTTK